MSLSAGAVAATAIGAEIHQSEGTAKYFRELRRRGLFRLSENCCLERLSRDGLSAAQRADLTLELSRTLTDHAAAVGDPEQTELWERSRVTIAEFLKREPENPRRLLLEVQSALVPAMIGHTRGWQAELTPFGGPEVKSAIGSLSEAIDRLREVEARIIERLRKSATSRAAGDGELRAHELRSLAANVRFRLGFALLDLARVHPSDSPERSALLLDVQKTLKSVPDAGDDPELVWMSRVAFVECSRLLGDPGKALRELDILDKQSPPGDVAGRLLAERIRALVAQKKFSEAEDLLAADGREQAQMPGELALLRIQLPIARWRSASAAPAPVPVPLLNSVEEQAARIERDVGGYWSYRAALLLQQLREIARYGPELAALAGRAQSAFNAGRPDEAVELYGEAAAQAHGEGSAELAFHFGFTRASIEIKSRRWADAVADLVELVEQYPNDSKAPEAHLLAAFALGKSYDEKPTAARRDEYARALDEHRRIYGKSPTAADAAWLLAKLNERQGKVAAALELYKSIPPDSKRGPSARVAVARSFETILDRLRARHEPAREREVEAEKTLRSMLPAKAGNGQSWSAVDAEVAIRLARILLRSRPPQFDAADALLVRAAAPLEAGGSNAADPADATGIETLSPNAELRGLVRQLEVVSLAGQGRFDDALERLHRLSATSPAELLRILDGIGPLQSDDSNDPYHALGNLQREAALRLEEHRSKLTAAEQRRLDECLARAYAATGEPGRGVEIYEKLVDLAPRDSALVTAYAELLMKCGSNACLKKALATWRKLEAREAEASPEWFALRFQVCHTLMQLHETAEACQLLSVTRLVYPNINDDQLQKKFADLDGECAKVKRGNSKKGTADPAGSTPRKKIVR